VLSQARDLVRASVVSATLVASAQGAAGGLLFWAVGLSAPVVWGVVMAFFSLLPVTGAWIVWLPAGVWLMVTGSIGKGLLLVGIGALVVSSIDNVLRPALLAGRSQMNGLLILISLIGGIGAFGLIGIVIGPVVVATMTSLLTAYTGPAAPSERDEAVPM
jgi:predicted PurR-regulated permease PerM